MMVGGTTEPSKLSAEDKEKIQALRYLTRVESILKGNEVYRMVERSSLNVCGPGKSVNITQAEVQSAESFHKITELNTREAPLKPNGIFR